ncbi:fragment of putative sulfate:proton symporter (anion:anion symporter or antiporter of the sulfate permease SulP family) [Candidatus Desulfosporosinus infrequens]|uniref:Fragment of putative sulfate:proton symporter (Anion:anion symporter or antiporter of the sulfate permease SulP family) n=1 Tax=Candidatus Desulfosporosinus infrequens TaxID=2043169 RepID=A0A2U3L3N7_9FIRM|nr:fragment of putative sulfate:proton symporter (anion:anion symporter or antiporter of the sulfate permease SulP family) [Candidatus Desulfosporosinus infrequens]
MEGNLYFGAASDLGEKLDSLVTKSKVFILRMKYVTTIDLTSISALRVFSRNVREAGGVLIISGVTPELDSILKKSDVEADVGIDNVFLSENEIFASTTNALARAKAMLNCGIGDNGKKSVACKVIDSVSTDTSSSSF